MARHTAAKPQRVQIRQPHSFMVACGHDRYLEAYLIAAQQSEGITTERLSFIVQRTLCECRKEVRNC